MLFILVFKWGIEGAARATVIAQGIGMCVALAYVNNTHPLLSIKKQDMLFDGKLFKESLKIGLPTSVQQCAIALGLIALLGIVNSFGTNTLTAYGAAGKIDTIIRRPSSPYPAHWLHSAGRTSEPDGWTGSKRDYGSPCTPISCWDC